MYKLISGDNVVGTFEKVVFTKKNPLSGCFVECKKDEASGLVAGGNIYAMTNSEDYKDYPKVAVCEYDGEVENSAELDYIRAMANLI